jgi:hypothetical protein
MPVRYLTNPYFSSRSFLQFFLPTSLIYPRSSVLFTAETYKMDPLTALGVAASIIQFVDFGSSLVSGSVERYRSATGASASNDELESLTEDLRNMSTELEVAPHASHTGQLSKNEVTLSKLSSKCHDVADELLAMLDDLRVRGKHKALGSLMQAIRSMGKEKKIRELRKRLQTIQSSLILCLSAIMRCEFDFLTESNRVKGAVSHEWLAATDNQAPSQY